jgi:hypothetical protein
LVRKLFADFPGAIGRTVLSNYDLVGKVGLLSQGAFESLANIAFLVVCDDQDADLDGRVNPVSNLGYLLR